MNIYTRKPFGSAQGRQNLFWQKIVLLMAVLVVLIIFLNIFQKQVRNSFFYVSSPISTIFLQGGKGAAGFFSSFSSFPTLKKDNANLATENQRLLASLALLQEAIKGNQDLQSALIAVKDNVFTLSQARIMALDTQNDTLLIDKGSKNGISENMPVISQEKVLFGKISKAYPNFSEVVLISNKKSALAVKIQVTDPVQTPIYGAVKGSGNQAVYMDLVNSDAKIQPGDVLVTSAQDGIFPKDLLVGKVQSSSTNDTKAFQTAQIMPFFNPKNTDSVFIITNYLKK